LRDALRGAGLAISGITYADVYEGIYFGSDPRSTERVFLNFLRSVDVLPAPSRHLKARSNGWRVLSTNC